MKQTTRLLYLLPMCFLIGCTNKTDLEATPKDALFCENILENIQTIEQLHITNNTLSKSNSNYNTIPYAMWFTAIDYAEILTNQSETAFRSAIRERFETAKKLGINTVFLQVRAYADAYYNSTLYAPGLSMSDTCIYDPLEIMLTEAHALGLSAHAWINPLRCQTDAQMEMMPDTYPIKQWYMDPEKNGTWIVKCADHWWLNPAYPEVRQLIADGVTELAHNYDIDGIHIDDYFYPTTEGSFDEAAFIESNATNLPSFRMEQCNKMVQAMYEAVKAVDTTILFGISPQGTTSGNKRQFADVDTWCTQTGYCDYIVPQLYFGLQNESAPFEEMATLWAKKTTCPDVSLWIGICTYKLGQEDPWAGNGIQEWVEDPHIPSKEITLLLSMHDIDGIAIYDYASTFSPDVSQENAMHEEIEAIRILLQQQKDKT